MKLLRLAVETRKWELAAHVLILGAITARQKQHDRTRDRQEKKRHQKPAPEHHQGQKKQRQA